MTTTTADTLSEHERLDRLEVEVAELMTLARQLGARYGIVVEDTTAEQVSA